MANANGFAPLVLPARSSDQAAFTPLALTVVKGATGVAPAFAGAPKAVHPGPPNPGAPACAPVVTLQRSGDLISGIRIQCSCGQVIELNCVYGE
jgi:hypothetical protein